MILAIDTSTAACTVALFDASGTCVASRDELIGRGHSERLAPLLAELLDGRRAEQILVGVGPGSFTGIRVGIAAAQGLAIGWDCPVYGLSSLALIAAAVRQADTAAAAVDGGHGELFVQQFELPVVRPSSALMNLPPSEAAQAVSAETVAGPGARALVEARGWGETVEAWPSAANAMRLSEPLRCLPPKPIYARAPDARARSAA